MSWGAVRSAYSEMAAQYIELFNGDWRAREDDTALVARHLTGLPGRVLDLGCGPGYWTAHLQSLGVDVTGVDLVPEFIAHARQAHPSSDFRLGSMTALGLDDGSVSGILSWYSTIHLPPSELGPVLAEFRRLLDPTGMLVIGFFDSEGGVAEFDHKVFPAYRWSVDVFSERLADAGFAEVERTQKQFPERPDRRYAAIAARASWSDGSSPALAPPLAAADECLRIRAAGRGTSCGRA